MAINDTMFARPPIYARRSDLIDLQSIATRACLASPGLPLLREELKRLTVVPDEATTRHVRLGSRAV